VQGLQALLWVGTDMVLPKVKKETTLILGPTIVINQLLKEEMRLVQLLDNHDFHPKGKIPKVSFPGSPFL